MNFKSLLAIVCISFILDGCNKDLTPPPITLTTHKQTVTLKGTLDSKDTIYVVSNGEWVVNKEPGANWISIEPSGGAGDGMIIITTIQKNNTSSRRTTNVEVKSVAATNSILITVVQVQFTEVLTSHVYGGEGYDILNDFTHTIDGGYISVGFSTSTLGDGTGSKGGQDVWVVKFSNEGEKMWHRKYGGSLDDAGNSIVRTADNNYLILGSTQSSDGDVSNLKGGKDVWLMNIDSDGNLLWEKTIGGGSDDSLLNLKSTGDGNYLMAGWTKSNDGDVTSNHGDADAWIVMINRQGDIQWEKSYGGSMQDFAYDAMAVSDGGYVFTGGVSSTDGDASDRTGQSFSAWFVKINGAGSVAGKVYLGDSGFEYGTVALEALNGDYIFAGETNTPGAFDGFHGSRDAFICRIDAAGNIRWKKAYGGTQRDEPGDLMENDDGHFVFAGLSTSNDGTIPQNLGEEDAWIMKLDGDGNIIANTTLGGENNDYVTSIKHVNQNNFSYVGATGSFEDAYPELEDIMHGWFQVINLQ